MSQEYKMTNRSWCSKFRIYLFLKGSQKDQSNIRSHQKRIIVYPLFGTDIEIPVKQRTNLGYLSRCVVWLMHRKIQICNFFFWLTTWFPLEDASIIININYELKNKLQAKRNHKKMINSTSYKLANFLQRVLFPISSIGVCDYYIHFSL